MAYSNDPQPSVYAKIPSPFPNIDFPAPYWINKLVDLTIVGCLNPDIAIGAFLIGAAAKAFWSIETPSTKQLIEQGTGHSWICNAKQIATAGNEGEQMGLSSGGRFVYGLWKGLDIAAYHAFFLSTGAKGVIDFGSFIARFNRRCNGDQSPYRGLSPVGGWPVPSPDWAIGPQYLTAGGGAAGPFLFLKQGQVGCIIAWCSFSNLFGNGGVIVQMNVMDWDTGEIFDLDVVNNLYNTSQMAVVQYFTTEGLSTRDRQLVIGVKCIEAVEDRMVTVSGGCYIRSWYPGDETAPPYWNMKTMLQQKGKHP